MIKNAIKYSPVSFGTMIAACFVMIGVVSFSFITQARAVETDSQNDKLVTIYDRGKERVILTKASSVREALDEAGITLSEKDAVEPTLGEELVAKSYYVNIYRARPVVVVDGHVRQKIMTPYQTTDKIVKDAGLDLRDEDETSLQPTEDLLAEGAGVELSIDRATEFTLVLYGKKTIAYTQAKTVGEMLAQKDVKLGAKDQLSLSSNTPIKAGMTVELWRNGKQTVTEEQEIPFPIEKIEDSAREAGYREIKTPGIPGKKTVTYEIIMQNGIEVSRTEIQSVTQKEPEKQVEVIGTKPSFDGDFGEALAKLRQCESGGNYANKNNPLYRGAYQFGYTTWANNGGYYDPADAPPALQDAAAAALYQRRGWQPWPACSKALDLPDIYR